MTDKFLAKINTALINAYANSSISEEKVQEITQGLHQTLSPYFEKLSLNDTLTVEVEVKNGRFYQYEERAATVENLWDSLLISLVSGSNEDILEDIGGRISDSDDLSKAFEPFVLFFEQMLKFNNCVLPLYLLNEYVETVIWTEIADLFDETFDISRSDATNSKMHSANTDAVIFNTILNSWQHLKV